MTGGVPAAASEEGGGGGGGMSGGTVAALIMGVLVVGGVIGAIVLVSHSSRNGDRHQAPPHPRPAAQYNNQMYGRKAATGDVDYLEPSVKQAEMYDGGLVPGASGLRAGSGGARSQTRLAADGYVYDASVNRPQDTEYATAAEASSNA